MRYLAAICLIWLFSQSSICAQEWQKITSAKSPLSFSLPGVAQHHDKELNGVKVEEFQFRDLVTVFGVVVSDFSAVGVDFSHTDTQEYYQAMKESTLVADEARLISEQSVVYHRLLGKEIHYTLNVKRKEYTYFKRFFFRGPFIYQLVIGGPTRMQEVLLDKKDLFFNSVEFK